MDDLNCIVTILGVFLLTAIILACPSLMMASIILGWNASVKFLFLVLTGIDFIGLSIIIGERCM
jgi:hypothetical protein